MTLIWTDSNDRVERILYRDGLADSIERQAAYSHDGAVPDPEQSKHDAGKRPVLYYTDASGFYYEYRSE